MLLYGASVCRFLLCSELRSRGLTYCLALPVSPTVTPGLGGPVHYRRPPRKDLGGVRRICKKCPDLDHLFGVHCEGQRETNNMISPLVDRLKHPGKHLAPAAPVRLYDQGFLRL